MLIQLTPFATGTQAGADPRHFDADFAGTKITTMTPEAFVAVVNKEALSRPLVDSDNPEMPFCKHLFIPVSAFGGLLDGLKSGFAAITEENKDLLKTRYAARRDFELEYLQRWFESSDAEAVDATWIDVVLYANGQLKSEHDGANAVDASYGIVSINAGVSPHEEPMLPATVVRNALGREFGGNGAPIDVEYYKKSVAFHKKWALVK